jgi:uncharacterized BrkB/YihY/UPF0761 family membrane protein
MPKKSLPRRAIKYALISSSIIMFFVFYRILTSGAVGTVGEIVFRIIVSAVASFLTMWVVFMLYLFFNPDAETPRKRTKFGEKERK